MATHQNESPSPRPLVVIARDSLDAQHLVEELAFFAPTLKTCYLPDWDILPYDAFSPTAAISAQRIASLIALQHGSADIIITPAAALLLPYAPPQFFAARAFNLKVGSRISLPALTTQLQEAGYTRCERVLSPSEYAVYGGQIDIYPLTAAAPFRLVMLDDEIEQIRLFDPATQLSTAQQTAIDLTPANEYDFSEAGRTLFTQNFYDHFGSRAHPITRAVSHSQLFAGIEFYLPLFYPQCGRLLDFIPAHASVMIPHALHESLADFIAQAKQRYQVAASDEEHPAVPVAQVFATAEETLHRLKTFNLIKCLPPTDDSKAPLAPLAPRQKNPLAALIDFIKSFVSNNNENKNAKVMIITDNRSRADALSARLRDAADIKFTFCETFAAAQLDSANVVCSIAPLRAGFIDNEESLAVFTEAEIFEMALPPRARRAGQGSAVAADVLHPNEICEGELVVHQEYGIGKVGGLKNREVDGSMGEYLELHYADGQRLWLPIAQMHMLSRHYGEAELSKMGGKVWQRAKAKAAAAARDTAARILEINARRALAEKTPPSDSIDARELLEKFIGDFPYIETPDQERVTEEILTDLRAAQPMDRLVTADVGFGKTEIAMRAAALVAFGGGQVALIAPTTLLAEQHMRVFAERFADFPVNIACLTRLTPRDERLEIIKTLASGELNILIGTHAVLQKTIKFRQLRLAVIDEEHRFGVRHKEQFKVMRASVDLLALSATPIPRTFAMALEGVRELSIMATPPTDRLAIKSFIMPYTQSVVVEACERELRRGGQVFFIHNEIQSIDGIAAKLNEWLPNARIATIHGAMPPRSLEAAMRRFIRREIDILLATTIIESGIDIQNANTILINRADRMGISRLHQLRGRVGRSNMQAYAYFLIPNEIDLRPKAEMRLNALMHHSNLGGGFHMSMRDLEIRGMGELLGERQSGVAETVGCQLYQRMIQSALNRIKAKDGDSTDSVDSLDSDITAQINLSAPALLPDSYIHAANERITYYRRLTAAQDEATIAAIANELQDRFGKLPPAARRLQASHELRLLAQQCEAQHIRINKDHTATVQFAPSPRCAPALLEKIQQGTCRPTAATSVRLPLGEEDEESLNYDAIKVFLQDITAHQPNP